MPVVDDGFWSVILGTGRIDIRQAHPAAQDEACKPPSILAALADGVHAAPTFFQSLDMLMRQ